MVNKKLYRKLKEELSPNIFEIVTTLLPAGKEEENNWVALNPTRIDTNLGSFKICISGEKSGCWIDFATGDKGGDVISLYRYINNNVISPREAALELAREYAPYLLETKKYGASFDNDFNIDSHYEEECGDDSMISDIYDTDYKGKNDPKKNGNRIEANRIWNESIDPLRTPVSTMPPPVYDYLKGRAIRLNECEHSNIRFNNGLDSPPNHTCRLAMVCAVKKYLSDEVIAIHITYLEYEGNKCIKAKNMKSNKISLGETTGGSVQIGIFKEGGILYLTEGVEDAFSLHQYTKQPVWAVLGANNYKSLVLPSADKTKQIIIAADNDKAGVANAMQAAQDLIHREYTVKISYPPERYKSKKYKDWNECIQAKCREKINE